MKRPAEAQRCFNYYIVLVFIGLKIILAGKAYGTIPVIRQIFKCGSRCYTPVGVTDFGVIDIAARDTTVFLHYKFLPYYMYFIACAFKALNSYLVIGRIFYAIANFLPKFTAAFCESASGFHWFL